nr:hypothetical protein [Mycolicibacterium mucogenicum]
MRRPGQPRQRRRVHHAAAHRGRRQEQGGSGPAEESRRRGRHRGRQQCSGGFRHRLRGPEERHHRRPLDVVAALNLALDLTPQARHRTRHPRNAFRRGL